MRRTLLAALALAFAGCSATPYQPAAGLGGYVERQQAADLWSVRFTGNGFTTLDTAEAYWLFRCAELAVQHGYDGFEIVSDLQLGSSGKTPYEAPHIEGLVHMLRQPFAPLPPKVFDAVALKHALEPHVHGEKCHQFGKASGNVCRHERDYLSPPVTR